MSETQDQEHRCVICDAFVESKEALQDHFRKHANGVIDKTGRTAAMVANAECICDLCGKIYESVTETIKHRFRAHPDSSKYFCPFCGKQFPLKIHREKHIISHDADENLNTNHQHCEECNFVFFNEKAMNFHRKSVHDNLVMRVRKPVRKLQPPKEHTCVMCDAKVESKEALRAHFRKHANNQIDRFGKTTKLEPKRQDEENDCRCDVCGNIYPSITEVIKHRFKYHPNSPKFYCCYCGKQFPLKVHRDKHMTTHDPEEAKKEEHKKCAECNALFYNEKALSYHQSSAHKRVIQMLQPIATPPPSNKIKVNSMNDALSVYYCHLCGVEYVIKFNLQQHLEKVHTQEERDAVPEDLIKCTMCAALFCSKRAYNVHNTYHKPNDLYVTSEQQRLKTVTKVDQDFDIRRVSVRPLNTHPRNVKRRLQRRQAIGWKKIKETLETKIEEDISSSDEEVSDAANLSSDSESDVPLNRRIATS